MEGNRNGGLLQSLLFSGGNSGGGGGGGIVAIPATANGNVVTLGKTWNEVNDLFASNFLYLHVFWGEENGYVNMPVASVYVLGDEYCVEVIQDAKSFNASSADGYPSSTFN